MRRRPYVLRVLTGWERPISGTLLATVGLVVIGLVFGVVPAQADPTDPNADSQAPDQQTLAQPSGKDVPSEHEVDEAEAKVKDASKKIGEVQAKLVAADQKLRHLEAELETRVEEYNTAVDRLSRAELAATEARQKAIDANRDAKQKRDALGDWAAHIYRSQTHMRELSAYLTADGPQTLLDENSIATMAERSLLRKSEEMHAADVVAKVRDRLARDAVVEKQAAATDAEGAKRRTEEAQLAQQHEVQLIDAEKSGLLQELAKLQKISVDLAVRRQNGLADKARKLAERRRIDNISLLGGEEVTTMQGRIAMAFALAQLGEPYIFGADGPGTWDCSGLTMRAWQRAGVVMPHFARGQYWQSQKIGLAELRPGDLMYWANNPADSNTIHHVAMYLGGGRMVHAPRPGKSVELQSMWYMGAPTHYARPR